MRKIFASLCFFGLLQLSGCGRSPGGSGSTNTGGTGSGTASGPNLTGNWEFQVTSSGNIPFTVLSGFLNQFEPVAGGFSPLNASLQVQSDGCFENSGVVDMSGGTSGSTLQLNSFPSYSQTLSLNLSISCANGVSACGSYSVSGGCADGETGNIVGFEYPQLGGSFQTAPNASPGLQMVIAQSGQGTGQGTFQVSGTLAFTGASCVTTATINQAQSYVSGGSLHLIATSDTADSVLLTIDGTINHSATTITLNSVSLGGSNCLTSLNGAVLS